MPLDPSIITGIGAQAQQQQPNMLANFAQVQQIQQNRMAMAAQQQAMMLGQIKQSAAQLDLQQQQLAAHQQQQAVQMLTENKGDVTKTASQLISVGNQQGFALLKNKQAAEKEAAEVSKMSADIQKTQTETQINKLSHAANLMTGLEDQPPELQGTVYQTRRALAIQAGFATPDQLPPVWNEDTKRIVQGLSQQAISAKDQLQQKLDAAKAAQEAKHQDVQERQAALNEQNLNTYRGAEVQNMTAARQLEAKRVGIEAMNAQTARGGLALRQKEFGMQTADPLQSLSGAQLEMAKKYASGDFKLPPAGSRAPGAQAIRQAALAINPNLSDDTFTVKHDFNDPKGKNGANLATIGRIAEHIGRFEKNSGAMSTLESGTYGMGATTTGNQKTAAGDAHAISAELEKLYSGGVGTKEQTQAWQQMLRSPSAGIRQRAVDEISQLAGAQFTSMNQAYKAQTQEDLPLQKYVSPVGRKWLQQKGINVTGAEEQAPAAAAPKGVPTVGAMFNGEKVLKVTRVK
jgi:hypothetical protein